MLFIIILTIGFIYEWFHGALKLNLNLNRNECCYYHAFSTFSKTETMDNGWYFSRLALALKLNLIFNLGWNVIAIGIVLPSLGS